MIMSKISSLSVLQDINTYITMTGNTTKGITSKSPLYMKTIQIIELFNITAEDIPTESKNDP